MREVRRLRQEKGWNQTELAFYAGLAPSVISEIETGKRNPSAGTLQKLADALEVDVPGLFERAQDLKAQAPLPFEYGEQRRAAEPGLEEESVDLDDLDLEALLDLYESVEEQRNAVARAIVRKGPFKETELSVKLRQRREAREKATQDKGTAAETG